MDERIRPPSDPPKNQDHGPYQADRQRVHLYGPVNCILADYIS